MILSRPIRLPGLRVPGLHVAAAGIVCCGLLAIGTPAQAQMITSREGIALQNQILELRHELHALQAQVGNGNGGSNLAPPQPLGTTAAPAGGAGAGPGNLVAQLLLRVARLEDQVRNLRGQVDTLGNALKEKTAELDKKIGDLAFQVQQGTGGAGPTTPGKPPARTLKPAPPPAKHAKPAGPPAGLSGTPADVLRQGYAALAHHDDKTALAAANYVLGGKDTAAGYNALFLKAQALAATKDWQHAALAYDDLYNRDKTGPHAQDALLGLSVSFTAIGARSAACSTLDSMRSQFPTPRANLKAKIAAARKGAGCR